MPAAGIPYHAIPTGKLRRQLAWRNVTDLTLRVPAGFGRALALLGRLRPDVVVATGGFVAVPTAVAAAVAAPPAPGPRAGRRAGAREPADRPARGPGRGDLRRVGLGVPARARSWSPATRSAPSSSRAGGSAPSSASGSTPPLPLTYVTGGALGAHRVNRVVGAALAPLLAVTQLVHQAGDNAHGDLAWLRSEAARLPPPLAARYHVRALVGEELGDLYAAASLVVGRAGAGTVTELAALGLPAILVPLPGRPRRRADGERARPGRRGRRGAPAGGGAHAGASRPRGRALCSPSRRGSGRWPPARAPSPRPTPRSGWSTSSSRWRGRA